MERYQRIGTATCANKIELFQYLSGVIAQSTFGEGKVVITTYDKNILQTPADDPVV